MTYSSKAKLKTLYVRQILEEETDADHGLSMRQIIDRLQGFGISAERKSIYRDIEALREFGCDVRTYQRNPVEYAIVRRDFALDELMLMVDAVQSCKALTARQCKALTTNIKLLASDHQRAQLERRIHVPGRVRTEGESVFGNVDALHEAMRLKRKVEFHYYRRMADGSRVATNGGLPHVVTPVELAYADGFYYLTAWDDEHEGMASYRLDRMGELRVSSSVATQNDQIRHHVYDPDRYESFGRFGGEEVCVTLEVRADKIEIVMDRFGDNVSILPGDAETARAHVRVRASEQFFGWIAGLGGTVKIAAPQSLVTKYKDYLRSLLEEA